MNVAGAIAVIGGALALAALIMAYPRLRRRLRRVPPLSARERRRLAALLPWQNLLDAGQRDRLARLTAQMLSDVRFVGCAGLAVEPDMRLVIAGQASLLCLGAQPGHFELPGEILLYPDAFWRADKTPDDNGLVDDWPMLAAGEAWPGGRVVLSWPDVAAALAGAAHNVVLHEFAHLLDFAAPRTEGAPPMASYDSWTATFSTAFDELCEVGSPVIDLYGAQSPTEFFAVAVEAFFQRGAALARAHPELYRVMAAYFDLDTASRHPCVARGGALTFR